MTKMKANKTGPVSKKSMKKFDSDSCLLKVHRELGGLYKCCTVRCQRKVARKCICSGNYYCNACSRSFTIRSTDDCGCCSNYFGQHSLQCYRFLCK